jgi:hypothetical protein
MDALSIAGVIVGIFGVAGAAWAAFYSGRAKYLTDLLQTENDALRRSKTGLEADNKTLLVRAESAEHKAVFMQELVQGAPDWNKLGVQMAKQHQEVISSLSSVTSKLGDVANALNRGNQ